MTIKAPSKKPITIDPVRPNVGLQADYRKRMDAMIVEMHDSVMYWLKAAYRANQPEMAQDASPAVELRNEMRRLSKRWNKNFDKGAQKLAKYFAQKASDRSDASLQKILKESGFTIEFKMTAAANDVMQATIGEQVGLIKSISSKYLSDVEGAVMRSVAEGRDLKTLSDELQKRFGVTKKRAALIARDQNNKATASMNRVRQEELGITEAIWLHSHAGKEPRPEHVAFNKQKYKISEGMWSKEAGKFIWPGTEINCRCVSRSVIPGF